MTGWVSIPVRFQSAGQKLQFYRRPLSVPPVLCALPFHNLLYLALFFPVGLAAIHLYHTFPFWHAITVNFLYRMIVCIWFSTG